MGNIGKRAKKGRFTKGDKVLVDFAGDDYPGIIKQVFKTEALILFDDGDELNIPLPEIKIITGEPTKKNVALTDSSEEDEDDDGTKPGTGFNQYPVEWNNESKTFKLYVEEAYFYGTIRRTKFGRQNKTEGWAIDMWCKSGKLNCAVESIFYDHDPQEKLNSLNSDICAAVNKFIYHHLDGNFMTLHELEKKARQPIVNIFKLETLDGIIVKLKEFRDTAIRCGGQRIFTFQSDEEDEPPVSIKVDVTSQAMLLRGKAPSLIEGRIYDNEVGITKGKKGKRRGEIIPQKGDQQNIEALLAKLQNEANKSEQRKIRAVLRKLGHRGGARKPKTKE